LAEATGQGLIVLGSLGLSYCGAGWASGASVLDGLPGGSGPASASPTADIQRSMVLVSLVMANGVLIAANRTSPPGLGRAHGGGVGWQCGASNPMAWGVTLSALASVLLALYWPWLAGALKLAALAPQALAVALCCGVLGWPVMALMRRLKGARR
jgi:hypothetical protein